MINIFNFNKISAVSSQQSAVSSPKNFINLSPFIIFSLSLIFLTSCIPTTNSSANSYQNNQTTTKNINEERQEELRRQEELNRQNQENLNKQLVNAVLNKDTAQVRELLNNGADPNSKGGEYGDPVIYDALLRNYNEDIVRLLVNKGANTEIVVSSLGSSQLSEYIFSDNANPEIIQLLIEKGANVNATNMEGNTPLHMLALNDDLSRENIKSIAKILIDKGADINAKNSNGFTPMDEAERSKNKTLVSVLAEYGVRSTGAVKAYEANERRKQAEYERKKTCAHLYQGKLVEMEPGGFYIKYEVVGFSPQTGRVTLKCLSNLCLKGKSYGDYEELHCSEVD